MVDLKNELPDREIIALILQGEKEWYSLIIRRYNQRLYRMGLAILKDDDEVEDAMQVAYIKAYEHLQQFDNRSSFSTWLTRILINECLLRLKAKKRFLTPDQSVEEHAYNISMRTPLENVLNEELKIALEKALMQLPEKYRVVFMMREVEEASTAETMAALGLSESNVKVRLKRAKSMLREKLTGYYKSSNVFEFHLSRCNRIVDKVFQYINTA